MGKKELNHIELFLFLKEKNEELIDLSMSVDLLRNLLFFDTLKGDEIFKEKLVIKKMKRITKEAKEKNKQERKILKEIGKKLKGLK